MNVFGFSLSMCAFAGLLARFLAHFPLVPSLPVARFLAWFLLKRRSLVRLLAEFLRRPLSTLLSAAIRPCPPTGLLAWLLRHLGTAARFVAPRVYALLGLYTRPFTCLRLGPLLALLLGQLGRFLDRSSLLLLAERRPLRFD